MPTQIYLVGTCHFCGLVVQRVICCFATYPEHFALVSRKKAIMLDIFSLLGRIFAQENGSRVYLMTSGMDFFYISHLMIVGIYVFTFHKCLSRFSQDGRK